MVGVASRTRSKTVPDCSSSKRKKSDESVSGSKKRRIKDETLVIPQDDEVIYIKDDDYDEDGSEQGDVEKERKSDEAFVFPKNVEVILLDDEVKIDESGGGRSSEVGDKKDGNFDDENCGWDSENPIICTDVSGETESDDEEHSVGFDSAEEEDGGVKEGVKSDEIADDADEGVDEDSDSDESDEDDEEESEENETSDEDYKVDEVDEVSDDDDDDYDEEKNKRRMRKDFDVVEELNREMMDKQSGVSVNNGEEKKMRKDFDVVEELVREVNDRQSEICQMKNEKKGSINNDEIEHSVYGSVTNSTTFEKKGSFDPIKGSSSSNKEEESKKQEEKSVEKNVSDVSDSKNEESKKQNAKSVEKNVSDDVSDSKKEESKKENAKSVEKNVSDVSDSHEENQQNGKRRWNYSDKQKKMENNNGFNQRVKSAYFTSKDLSLVKLLAECYSHKKNSMKDDPILPEVNSEKDDVNPGETRKPPVSVEAPLIWSLKKVQTVELTEEEEEERRKNEELMPLWDEMEMYINESEAESKIGNLGTNEATQEKNGCLSFRSEHDIIDDDELGIYCKACGEVITESKYKTQLVRDRYPYEGYGKRSSSEDSGNASRFDYSKSQFNASDGDLDANFCHKKGTVWDLIPEVKETLYPHQQEGFEVIWKNMAGSINLKKLKNADPDKEGGCIISHAPGTGKTRLTIVFLMAYLKVFPKCFPVIVAPAGLLPTWEDEFKKWNIGVPFHNLNNPELSGKEHDDAVNELNWSNAQHSMEDTRMAKLISWYKETSILGISYTLYKNLAGALESEDEGGEFENEKTKNQASVEKRKEMGKFLRKVPGLLVLDEGHTPRNKRSDIWKVFSKLPTKKRIILSGTPFQNNCLELYNTLSLVKPSFPNMLPQELKQFSQKQEHKKESNELSWEPYYGNSKSNNPYDDKIQQLKLLMDPFVHVHKGEILKKKLPGIKNCVLRLKPDGFHKQILERFESSQNGLICENNQTMVSIHPSLFLECKLSEQEKSAVDKDELEKLRLNHNAGVKTWFLVEFVSLCAAANEKVLVFSQFLRPLHLIIDQLKSALKWTADEEILYIDGHVKDRQSLIHRFNDANSQAKILLASTKACSEGISLVGASRVLLLDVEWNPSVEKQAISRAYRIGQKKFVYIYHLLTLGTRECDKYCKQIEKYRLSELIFSAKNADNSDESKSRAADIEDKILDKMIQHENLKDMFEDCVIQVEGARI